MFFLKNLPTDFTAYASMAGYIVMIQTVFNKIPAPIRNFIYSSLQSLFFRPSSSTLTLIIEEDYMGMKNETYRAAQTYLSTKISPDAINLRVSKSQKDKHVNVYLYTGETINDVYQDVELKWRFLTVSDKKSNIGGGIDDGKREYFYLSFDKKHKDLVLNSYIPYIESKAKEIKNQNRILSIYSLTGPRWEPVNFEHSSTFQTMAMEDDIKRTVIADLDRFIKRKEFYKRVGKAWKRGYLLYGPPGTGKSSLVAAMANYLQFDIYDLQLTSVMRDLELRKLLLATRNRSILVIEDIDSASNLLNKVEQPVEGGKNRGDSQV